jgi:branched-chain amino acid transport system substrate-binding protein
MKKKSGKIVSLLLTAVMVLTLGAGCGGQGGGSEDAKEIKMGTILPLSGSQAPLGKIGQQARDMAIEEINAAGGIESMGGAKIKMVYADSKQNG